MVEKRTDKPKKFCFVISPIGDSGTDTRNRADGILREIIMPALEGEYRVERADHDKTPGIVTDRIIKNIIDADLVVADLTGLYPNVMYELAVRHASERPVVQLMEEGAQLPFDIQEMNTIFFTADLFGRSKAIRDLQQAAQAAAQEEALGNPIRRVQEHKVLAERQPDGAELSDLLMNLQSQVSLLRQEVRGSRVTESRSRATSTLDTAMNTLFIRFQRHPQLLERDIRVQSTAFDRRTQTVSVDADAQGSQLRVEHAVEPLEISQYSFEGLLTELERFFVDSLLELANEQRKEIGADEK